MSTRVRWIEQVEARGCHDVATRLDLKPAGSRHFGPCPACKEDRRSKSDARRGAVFLAHNNRGWKCGYCGEKGDCVRLATFRLYGEKLPAGDPRWRELRATLAGLGLCDAFDDTLTPGRALAPIIAPPVVLPDDLPRPGGAALLWDDLLDVDRAPELAAWLVSRGLDVDRCAGLVRALPDPSALPHPLPDWARARVASAADPDAFEWLPWSAGWRALLPAWDHRGRLASLRARWTSPRELPAGGLKGVAARAGAGSSTGLVLADPIGVDVLRTGAPPADWPPDAGPFRVVITEGEPDFLTWATLARPDGAPRPAVFGLWNGGWTEAIAARVPYGSRVDIRVHEDKAGDLYVRRVAESLKGRAAKVYARPSPPPSERP